MPAVPERETVVVAAAPERETVAVPPPSGSARDVVVVVPAAPARE